VPVPVELTSRATQSPGTAPKEKVLTDTWSEGQLFAGLSRRVGLRY
jgi:hypothetical protein